jgi:hypothetical protein
MSKMRFADVWDAIEDTPAQAESMKLRSTSKTHTGCLSIGEVSVEGHERPL